MIENCVRNYYRDKDIDVQIRSCGEWQELCKEIRQRKADVIIIAQSGVKGLDIITGLNVPAGKVIWFSDLDFALQAYRLNVAYFNLLPVTQEKVSQALRHIETAMQR
ncbi:response regulator [Qiania dongpingensis]|uniref:Uncharacterized protein n=1 Tax=Qiania dongpingensis TaxID=2763669 RepID=A0A7G9G4Q1_9FIRM|nr:hypothetical protein [Qiania dongpingensis]QNM05783.1 hypothetical protein H9Q78_01000 [Qiania dongpingensis]